MAETSHIGKKITRIRELRGMKQETLAEVLGMSQQAISKLELSDSIEDTTLARIANALNITPDGIRNFNEEAAINYIQNNYEGANQGALNVSVQNSQCTFNPLDKWLETLEENKKLYERLLQSEKEKVGILQKLLEGKQ